MFRHKPEQAVLSAPTELLSRPVIGNVLYVAKKSVNLLHTGP
ncbi:hypothetical protein EC2762100_4949 [Escherichia coli 2762100]|nr:hypothetical protein EC2762100_4949 [Escherichia coli 2762100]